MKIKVIDHYHLYQKELGRIGICSGIETELTPSGVGWLVAQLTKITSIRIVRGENNGVYFYVSG